jgi:phosphoribosylformylglycinamidine synthase
VGALPVAATNNLNFGNPERPEIMRQLVESIEGMAEACAFFETPITGGNVSLYNETLGEGIYPTPVMGIVGLLDTARPVPVAFPRAGLDIVLLGGLGSSDEIRFGSTQYAKVVVGSLWGLPPALEMDFEKRVQAAVRAIVRAGLAEAAHDVSDGGFAAALAECTFGGVGAAVRVETALRAELALFHEGPSRVLLATSRAAEVQALAAQHGVPAEVIGRTGGDRLKINAWIDAPLADLRDRWRNALERELHA